MSFLFKAVALLIAIFCGVWIAVLWRWQATSRDMSTSDIIVYLGALPLTVFALLLLMRWAWRGAAARQSKLDAATVAGVGAGAGANPAAGASAAVSGVEERLRHATFRLLGSHLICSAGANAADVLAAAKDSQSRPMLDAELKDVDGLPIFTARITGIDVEEMRLLLEPHLEACRALRAEWATAAVDETVLRALAALQDPLQRAAQDARQARQQVQPQAVLPPSLLQDPVDRRGAAGALPTFLQGPGPLPTFAATAAAAAANQPLRLLLGLPPAWSDFECDVTHAAVAEWLFDPAVDLPSADGSAAPRPNVMTSTGTGEALLLQADFLLQAAEREGRAELLLVAACHSDIGERAVERLERAGQLFSSARRPRGRMPSEGAAVLVLANAGWPGKQDDDQPAFHLHRPAVLQRDKPVDAAGRVDATIATQALSQALAASRLAAGAIGRLVGDADQHTARSTEMHAAAQALLPHLDGATDLHLLASVTGALEAVGPLVALCLRGRSCKEHRTAGHDGHVRRCAIPPGDGRAAESTGRGSRFGFSGAGFGIHTRRSPAGRLNKTISTVTKRATAAPGV